MIYGYENKNIELSQLSDLCEDGKYQSFKIDKIFVAGISRTYMDARVRVSPLLDITNDGDTVITSSLLNFSTASLQVGKILKMFFDKGVRIIAVLENFDSSLYDSTVLQEICDIIISYSRNLHKCKMASLDLRKEVRSVGRKPLSPSDIPDFENYYNEFMKREINKEQFARLIKVSRPTLDKLIKLYSEQNETNKKEKETD